MKTMAPKIVGPRDGKAGFLGSIGVRFMIDGADADVADVKRRILERYAVVRQLFVLNNDELRSYILRIAEQWFALTYVQIAIAVLVAVLGIVNTLTVAITDRRREFGVLRAVGGFKQQVRVTISCSATRSARSTSITSSRSSARMSPACGSSISFHSRWRSPSRR